MGRVAIRASWRRRRDLLAGVAVLACVAAVALSTDSTGAQEFDLGGQLSPDAQMFLEADRLVYDNDRNTVSAVGGVRIDYDGYRLVAQRVIYDRNTSRLMAVGEVEILDRDGNRFFSNEVDITDDFRDGFVRALRVETADATYFAADSAERRDGVVTTFNRGIYTACEPCEERPDSAPIWRIKAQQIIWNGETRTVRFRHARFELFGLPIAYLPYFEMPDPTVRQKSGFLMPGFSHSSERGFGVSVPYYFALSPTYDLTVTGRYYSRQGFLGLAEWRQQFDTGGYSLRIAGISQQDPGAWRPNRVDGSVTRRAMLSTEGRFDINPRWVFGWDALLQTDKNFAHTYALPGGAQRVKTSQVYLTGLNDRNYFDLRAMHFRVQEDRPNSHASARHPRQPWVLPSFDYQLTPDEPIAGGELTLTMNAQGLRRSTFDGRRWDDDPDFAVNVPTVRGADGSSGRFTTELEWKRTLVGPGGIVLTPLLHGRGDAIFADVGASTLNAINGVAGRYNQIYGLAGVDVRNSYYRYMATAGMEVRWPVLFSTPGSSHILEPVGQLFIRPDEPYGGSLGIPNEDAQSLVFDASTLFERDKFSGYDRIEGGTRANLGIRYSGSFGNGWSTRAIFGQSFHLAGRNPFASPDLVYAGQFSGLESRRSDYVGQFGITSPVGINLTAGGRFDERTFDLRRADLRASYSNPFFSIGAQYSNIKAQPDYGFSNDRQEVRVAGSAQLIEHWKVFASGTYDIENSFLQNRSIGFAYDDECFTFELTWTERRHHTTREKTRNIGFQISLRTLGDIGTSTRSLDSF